MAEYGEMARVTTTHDLQERRANYSELTGNTWNNLQDVHQVLMRICQHLEGDASTPVNEAEVRCFRDVLIMSRNKSEEILHVVNQIAEAIGVG